MEVKAKSTDAAGVAVETFYAWQREDAQGFVARFEEAEQRYKDHLQTIAQDYVENTEPGKNPLMLITVLNARVPELYKRGGKVDTNDLARGSPEGTPHGRKPGSGASVATCGGDGGGCGCQGSGRTPCRRFRSWRWSSVKRAKA